MLFFDLGMVGTVVVGFVVVAAAVFKAFCVDGIHYAKKQAPSPTQEKTETTLMKMKRATERNPMSRVLGCVR